MSLELEHRTFEREKSNLLAHEGKFAVISGDEVAGIFGTYEDALNFGYEKQGLKPFLVKKILSVEQAQYFTRELVSECHT
jgi:hypothetical protein